MSIAFRGAFSAAALLFLSTGASAHVSFEQAEVASGALVRAVLRVPHGCDGRATHTLRVVIPPGVVDVQPLVKAGWRLAVRRGPYAAPVTVGDRQRTDGVQEIIWSGGELPSEFLDEFVFRARFTQAPGATVHVPVTQLCDGGEAAWTEVPAVGRDAHALHRPAPSMRIAGAAVAAPAGTFRAGALVIEQPWARATPQGARVGGGYMRITNTGSASDRLVGGSAVGAGRFEIHEMATVDGVMRMRPLPDGLTIAPGQTVELRPGGHHAMFLDLSAPLVAGRAVRGSLRFERAGTVEIEYRVAPIGAGPPAAGEDHSHH